MLIDKAISYAIAQCDLELAEILFGGKLKCT